MTQFGIPGVKFITAGVMIAPRIGVMAREKTGKSVLATTLIDYPTKGKYPLVLAFDPTGPVSCDRLGMPVPGLIVRDEPGPTFRAKTFNMLLKLEQHIKGGRPHPFNSIVIDCASTMCEAFLEEIKRTSNNPNPIGWYGELAEVSKAFYFRVIQLGLPTIWITWLAEPETSTENKVTRFIAGGMELSGKKFPKLLAGSCEALTFLEKRIAMPNDPREFLSSDGYARVLHTRPYGGINCESRFNLPEPMPAHLGILLHYLANPSVAPQAQGAQARVGA